MTSFFDWWLGKEVTRDKLATRGGNPHFVAPQPDRLQQSQNGQRPTADHITHWNDNIWNQFDF